MKVLIRQNVNTKTGYELVSIDELGNEIVKPIESTVLEKKTGINWLVLPENESNRKLINPSKLEKAGGMIELTYKQSVKIGPRKKWEDYLTEDELDILMCARESYEKTVDELMSIAYGRRDEEKSKPMTEMEKLQAKMEKLQAKIDELKNNK